MRKILLILTSFALASCGVSSSSRSISLSEEDSASSSAFSSEDGQSSSSSDSKEQESSSDQRAPGGGSWTLTADALPENPSSGKHHNLSFSVINGYGETISFLGENILKGSGSKSGVNIDDTIQLSKQDSYFYMTSGSAIFLTFSIARITQFYANEDHDFTGVPSIYSADEMDESNGEAVVLTRKEAEDGLSYTYTCLLPHGRFRFANESDYAIYLYSITNVG